MDPGSAPPVSSDNEDKNYLMTLSVTELISNLRTPLGLVDYDRVKEILVEKESKLNAKITALTKKLEFEKLMRKGTEEQCKKRKNGSRYEGSLESVKKKNSELDHANTIITELRIKNTNLEDEKRSAESEAEYWKSEYKELIQLLMNGDAHSEVPNKLISEKDVDVFVDICDNKRGNTVVRSSPLQRKDLESGNNHVSAAEEVTRQSQDPPNKAFPGVSANGSSPSRIAVIEIKDSDDDDDDDYITSGRSNRKKEAAREMAATVDDNGHLSLSDQSRQPKSNARPLGMMEIAESFKRKWIPEIEILMDGCDTDSDTTSSLDSELDLEDGVWFPSKFFYCTCNKRRKT